MTATSSPGRARPLLVTGASGYAGRAVAAAAVAAGWSVVGTYRRAPSDVEGVTWVPLDVADRAAVLTLLSDVEPAAVVHSAAAVNEPDLSVQWAVNADGAGHVALGAVAVGARLVHISTDVVHGGRPVPYDEAVPPRPVYPYGVTKAAAEAAVRAIDPTAVVVRTSLIVSDGRSADPARICRHEQLALDLAAGRAEGTLWTDAIRRPVLVTDLAAALLELAAPGSAASAVAGVLNVGGAEVITFAELGRLYAVRHGIDPALVPVSTIAEAGAVRPGDVRLDTTRATRLLRTPLRGLRTVLTAPP